MIEGGHDVMMENPKAFETIIKEFIDASRKYL